MVVNSKIRQSQYGLFWGDEVLRKVSPPAPVIEHFLWEGDNVILLGKEKVGKSILSLEIACCLTTGEPFLDTYKIDTPREVLYIQAEGKRSETQERLENMIKGIDCDLSKFSHLFQPALALDTEKGMQLVKQTLEDNDRKPEVVIIDPLYMTIKGNLINSQDAQNWIGNVRKLFGKYNTATIIVHHKHREKRNQQGYVISEGDDAIFGSFAWKAFPDHIVNLRLKNKQKMEFSITCDTQRSVKIAKRIDCKLHQPVPLLFTEASDDDTNASVIVKRLLGNSDNGKTCEQIQDECDISRPTAYRALRLLRNRHVVYIDKQQYPYRYCVKDSMKELKKEG